MNIYKYVLLRLYQGFSERCLENGVGTGNLCYCHGHKLGGEEKGLNI